MRKLAIALVVATAPSVAAQPAQEQPPPKLDAIIFKSGVRLEGRVREQVRGQFVVLESVEGPTRTIMWDVIAEVVTWSAPAPVAPPPVPAPTPARIDPPSTGRPLAIGNKADKPVNRVSTTTGVNAGKDGASLSRTVTCKSDNDPTCKETTKLTVGKDGPKASYSSESDCSKNPGTDACKESKSLGVSGSGVGMSFTKDEVVAVDDKKRPSSSTNVSVTGGLGFGVGGPSEIAFANVDLSIKFLGGDKFPGKEGGTWFGYAFEPSIGFMAMSMSGGEFEAEGAGGRIGASAGFQLMKFGKLDPKSLKQRGFGVFLGAYAGYQVISMETSVFGTTMTTELASPSFGPQLSLVFPSYNAGTAKYSSSSLNLMVLPTGDSVYVSLGATTSF